ncbi:MAG: restriction endonuclease, partial [Blastocatellia bacterium]|nr:restriction endonuclease [Blastocatellia bacterium]
VKAANQFLNEQVNDRLKAALGDDRRSTSDNGADHISAQPTPDVTIDADLRKAVYTTDEELEGYRIVRAIVCSEVAATRVVGRDSKTYFAVLLDDNNRKPVARLWFNRAKKYLGVFDDAKRETRLPIESPEDIYQHAAQLRATVANYLVSSQGSIVESDLS